jgi:hypothetical protein
MDTNYDHTFDGLVLPFPRMFCRVLWFLFLEP